MTSIVNEPKTDDKTVLISEDDDPTGKASRGTAAPVKNWCINTL
jgi:hypothetical protein